MYLVQVDHVVYERKGGGGFTLPEAVRELHGVGNARILRANGAPVVVNAGSSYAVTYVAGGRSRLVRRGVRR